MPNHTSHPDRVTDDTVFLSAVLARLVTQPGIYSTWHQDPRNPNIVVRLDEPTTFVVQLCFYRGARHWFAILYDKAGQYVGQLGTECYTLETRPEVLVHAILNTVYSVQDHTAKIN